MIKDIVMRFLAARHLARTGFWNVAEEMAWIIEVYLFE
jgi:hypothetical protein